MTEEPLNDDPTTVLRYKVGLLLEKGPVARPWRKDAEADQRCQLCQQHNPVWWAPSEIWMGVMRHHASASICPSCFIQKAEAHGIGRSGTWQIYPPASLA